MMKPGAVGHIVAKIVLVTEFGADFLENGSNRVLFWNVESAATADVGEGFQRVRINQHGRPDRHEVQKDCGFLDLLNDPGMRNIAAVIVPIGKRDESLSRTI